MGQLIAFPKRTMTGNEPAGSGAHDREETRPLKRGPGADILLFTGVRYERAASLPSERLPSPAVRR